MILLQNSRKYKNKAQRRFNIKNKFIATMFDVTNDSKSNGFLAFKYLRFIN